MTEPNKVALVTGSAKRLGAAINRELHQQGMRVLIHCRHSTTAAHALMTELNRARPDSAAVITGSLSEPTQIIAIAEQAIAHWGRIDLLINNASAFYPTPIGEIDDSHWHEIVGSNMQGPLLLSQALSRELHRHQGAIVNMVDIHAQTPLKQHTLYCMAKAALVMMTKSLALELAPDVRVNGIAPGAILWPEGEIAEQTKAQILKQVPLARMGRAQDIAQAVRFLALDAPYITGQILAVDGGRSLSPLEGA
ncbi:pteridine reductase [Ferrimonas pelagia]|uniref:Pteridine reductase n=1 Tax=Ferrimonas pelagia TaxID=1177826 RepID=A0ABP9EJJ0_9GAMM